MAKRDYEKVNMNVEQAEENLYDSMSKQELIEELKTAKHFLKEGDKRILELKKENNDQKSKIEGLEDNNGELLSKSQKVIEKYNLQEEAHAKDIAGREEAHKAELEKKTKEIESNYEKKIKEIESNHEQEIAKIKSDCKQEFDKKESSCKAEIEKAQKAQESKLNKQKKTYEARIRRLENELEGLKQRNFDSLVARGIPETMQIRLETITPTIQSKLAGLLDDISKDIVNACIGVVEEADASIEAERKFAEEEAADAAELQQMEAVEAYNAKKRAEIAKRREERREKGFVRADEA